MGFARPDQHTLIFGCDICPEFIAAHDSGPPNFAECWSAAAARGWLLQKPIGYQWEHYCPVCAKLPEKDRIPRTK